MYSEDECPECGAFLDEGEEHYDDCSRKLLLEEDLEQDYVDEDEEWDGLEDDEVDATYEDDDDN